MKTYCLALLFLISLASNAQIRVKSALSGGNWNSALTWQGGAVPASNDTAEILSGVTVTINGSASNTQVGRLEISGTVDFASSAYPLVINGALLINSTGTLKAVKPGATFSKAVIINGSLVNNGTLNSSYAIEGTTSSTTGGITMGQAGAVTGISGTGVFGVIRQLVINNSYGVNLNVPLSISSKLILQNGLFDNRTNLTMDNTIVGSGPGGAATSSGNLRIERSQSSSLDDAFTFGATATLFITYFRNLLGSNPSSVISEGYEIPSSRSIHGITIDHPGGVSIKNDLTLKSGSVPLVLNAGIIKVNKGKTLICNSASFAGTAGSITSYVDGGLALAAGITAVARTYPVGFNNERRKIVISGVKATTGTVIIRFEIVDTLGGSSASGIVIDPSVKRRGSVTSGSLHSYTGLSFDFGADEVDYATGTLAMSATWNGVYANMGAVVKTLYSISAPSATYTSVQSYAFASPAVGFSGDFDSLRARWADFLIGGSYSLEDTLVADRVTAINTSGNNYWRNNFVRDTTGRTTLWTDLNYSHSEQITTSYSRLKSMALAYVSPGTALFHNDTLKADIIYALDWLYTNHYNETTVVPPPGTTVANKNWWDYRIGIPLRLNDISVLMYDQMDSGRRNNYMAAIGHCIPNIGEYTGANLVWVCTAIAIRSIVKSNPVNLLYGRDQLSPVFQYVTSGDGFYVDGSFIQHTRHPYNGAYGLSLLTSITDIMYLFANSSIDIAPASKSNVVSWVYNSFEPLMFRGGLMSMVRGREIARAASSEHGTGRNLCESLLILKEIVPSPDGLKIGQMLKHWFQTDSTFTSYYQSISSIKSLVAAKELMTNASIIPRYPHYAYHQFANMDRAVQHTPDYAFGISMHSSRIYNFEITNSENLKGWHTSDGMTYLYNKDLKQYDNFFWPTVNAYRLPGTTVEENVTATQNRPGLKEWVGGTTLLNRYGNSGMYLAPYENTLNAKKSWFMFDNEIVALGCEIINGDNKNVSTYIEQRKITSTNSNTFSINGVTQSASFGTEATPASFYNVDWAHLSGNVAGADIGYYFPGSIDLKGLRQPQTGTWADLATGESTFPRTQQYITLWKGHGNHTTDNDDSYNKYAYVLLPGFSSSETQAYYISPQISVIRNDRNVQAAHESTQGIIAANFWNNVAEYISLNGDTAYLRCNKKASVMVKEGLDSIAFAVSDPTMIYTGNITIRLNNTASAILFSHPAINVTQLTPYIEFTVNADGLMGSTCQLILSKGEEASIQPVNMKVATTADDPILNISGNILLKLLNTPDRFSLDYTVSAGTACSAKMTVLDMYGRVLGTQQLILNEGENKCHMNISHFASGTYIAMLLVDGKVYSKKYMK